MKNKILKSLELIKENISGRPVLLCSFGKDSMVLLHLVRQIKADIPVIFWKVDGQPKRYEFSQQVIKDWNLKVYDYPPTMNDVMYKDGKMNGVAGYWAGIGFMAKVLWITPPTEHFSCILEDILDRPTCTGYTFKWDTVLSGHKQSDVDMLLGKLAIKEEKRDVKGLNFVYPLHEWTNQDIWQYIKENNVPFNDKKYAQNGSVLADTSYNENYHSACSKCINPIEGETVYCERDKDYVQNAGKQIDYENKLKGYTDMMKQYMDMGG